MDSYFDLLPTEIIQEVLHYVNNNSYIRIYQYEPLQKALDSPFFWRGIYNEFFPLIDYSIWINLKGGFYDNYNTYIKLKQSYDKALTFLQTHGTSLKRTKLIHGQLRYIKNIKVLLVSKEDNAKIKDLWLSSYGYGDNMELSIFNMCSDFQFMIDTQSEIVSYSVTIKDVLNLLTEIIYNNLQFTFTL